MAGITVSSDITCNCGCNVTVKYEVVIGNMVINDYDKPIDVVINTYDK